MMHQDCREEQNVHEVWRNDGDFAFSDWPMFTNYGTRVRDRIGEREGGRGGGHLTEMGWARRRFRGANTLDGDEGGFVRGTGLLNGRSDVLEVSVTVLDSNRVPAVRLESLRHILGERNLSVACQRGLAKRENIVWAECD